MIRPLASLLSVGHLISLEFDTAGSHPMSSRTTRDIHLCRLINALLPTLRSLRCRMDAMCGELLKSPPETAPLDLEEVIVNVSISYISDKFTAFHHPSCCLTGSADHLLREIIEGHACKLVQRMRNPRIAKVIYHDFLGLDMWAFDAIAGSRMQIQPGKGRVWDAEEFVDEYGKHLRE